MQIGNPEDYATLSILVGTMANTGLLERQVVSRMRVVNHGEVLTGKREVNAMLDLVAQEANRIESRFLEPACGNGNFLVEILTRKLSVVENRYGKSQTEYERYAILAVSSIYGIDILEDNIRECRQRLFAAFDGEYTRLFKDRAKDTCRQAARYILDQNIIWGDAISLKTVGDRHQPIVFSEWSPVNGDMLKRRDFTFSDLLGHEGAKAWSLCSDLGADVFLPVAQRDYPLIHFLELANGDTN